MPKSKRISMGKIDQIKPGSIVEKSIMACRVAVVNDNGVLYGIESDCKHMRASLATGKVSDGQVTCQWHGWKYDLKSGNCLTVDGFKLKKYQVEVDDGEVYLIL